MSAKQNQPDVYVITGGAGGMGYATALRLGKYENTLLLLSDIDEELLESAKSSLAEEGIEVETNVCDVSNPDDIIALADRAAQLGNVRGVVHTAGVSPSMDDYTKILQINVLGTIYVDRAFLAIASEGFTLINVASMAAHMLPNAILSTGTYKTVREGPSRLFAKLDRRCRMFPAKLRAKMAYPISKNFVTWYTRHLAPVFGAYEAHVISVSPGSFDTRMGQLEKDAGAGAMIDFAAIKRFGEPDEVAALLTWLVHDSPVYLTGTDILIDGGVIANMTLKDAVSATK